MKTDPASRRRRRIVTAIVVVAAVVAAVATPLVRAARRDAGAPGAGAGGAAGRPTEDAPRAAPDVRAPEGVRIRVEVLNATTRTGLARRATMLLRDAGFDVVKVGTSRARSDSTVVLDRTGHPEWARLVADALGGARVESRPDSSGYLDVTVLLGATYRPPTEPFYP